MLSLIIPFTIGVIRFKTLNVMLRVLFSYVIVCSLAEGLSVILASYNIYAYYFSQNVFTLLEYTFLVTIYFLEFKSKKERQVIWAVTLIYVMSVTYYFIRFDTFTMSTSIPYIIEAFILIGLSVYFLYKTQVELTIPSLKDYPFFWVNCAILIYFSTSLILFLCNDYLENCKREQFESLWSLHLIGNIIYNNLLGIAIWKTK
jgi:hypothetical protein